MNDTVSHAAGPRRLRRPVPPTWHRLWRGLAGLLCALGLLCAVSPRAVADSPTSGGDVQVAQTLGDRELTVVLRRVTGVPGPLHVDVITHQGTAAGKLKLGVVPTGVSASASDGSASGTTTDAATVTLGAKAGTYSAVLQVAQAGPWELTLNDGERTARIPFTVSNQATSPAEKAVYAGFIGAGVLILVTVVVAVRVRRGWWTLVPAGGVVACLAVAVTGALLTSTLPLPAAQGTEVDATIDGVKNPYTHVSQQTGEYSRSPVTLAVRSSTARAGRTDDIKLVVTDTATGLPADDLVVHDGALMHLMIIGPSGQLWHLHPVRTAAGTYEVPLTLPEAGHYAVSAELARRGGGIQEVRSATGIEATGDAGDAASGDAVTEAGAGTRTVNGVDVKLTTSTLTAGKSVVLTARVGDEATLQPWLGMLGHMIVVGPVSAKGTGVGEAAQDAEVWGHSHSMGAVSEGGHDMTGMEGMAGMEDPSGSDSTDMASMSGLTSVNGDSTADETVAAYGPDISFVYTFPKAGYYRIWIQAERDNTILTVPYLLHVTDATESTR
ncbi:hypothetical protein SUDANB145_06342 [Streptomyces sp. enrichment culture]|uniref:hypothetical protein n=1 Tax=Streptomyces sp. enrichment culture TaxID=1795815 RepID=UPI003F5548EE